MKKVLLYEDNNELAESISLYLEMNSGFLLLSRFQHPMDVLFQTAELQPDIVLMDIDMPMMDGISAVKSMRKAGLQTPVLMLTVFEDDQNIIDAICVGANGYILKKNLDLLETYIEEAYNGGAPLSGTVATRVLQLFANQNKKERNNSDMLTEREKEVLALLSKGYSYKMIAAELYLSIDTIRVHIKKIYQKLGVNSATEALNWLYTK